ncbi:SpoIID/LytB domain-containing protein [Peredibacter sp. HCB2-198]|uniref:SpoIID/LytB domain-containing protein n=1 Tax=Peredibacter sp. HCB2-198 TaxID=3383025 RepID=UPI0038B5D494
MLKTGSCFFLLLFTASAYAAVPSVKVLIAKSLKRVVVEGMDLQKTIHTQHRKQQYSGRKTIAFNCNPSASKSKAQMPKNPLLVASLSSPTGLVSWGKHKYQGELQLLTNPGQESCDLVNLIPMENYITTLLSKEMNGTWPVEALKAQAVAARTYAYDRIKKGMGLDNPDKLYHLESSEKDQVSGTFHDITEKTLKAAKETNGMILVGPSGKIAPAFFHSKCGGKTLRPDQVWGGVEEGYRSVNCTFCQKTGMKDWNYQIKGQKLTSMVDQVLKRYYADEIQGSEVKLMPDSLANSELRMYVGDRLHIIKKSYLRNLAGRELLPSNNFIVSMKNKEFMVKGHGYGHGVGLCQLGALELAKRGYDYRQILSFYFPRHRLKKAY